MDLDDDDFELPARTCPPVGSRNTGKNKPGEDLINQFGTDKRPLKKRRTITQKTQNRDAKIKQNIGFKCSPHLLFDLLKSLDRDQRQWVDDLGFGILLSMPNCRLPKELTVWLVNHFSWRKQALSVRGRTIKIKTVMKKLLGIPDGPFPVPLPRSKRGKSKGIYPTDEDKEMKDEKSSRGLSYKATYESLIANHDAVQFKRSFMLYVLCIYFAPSSGHFINLSYSPIVSNVHLIKDMNWCDHVADVLIEGIREYRDSKAVNVNVHGCVHVLLLIYIDMVKSPILVVPPGIPRVIYVTTELLELLDLHDLKLNSCDGTEYGKLELADSPCGEEFVPPVASNVHHVNAIPGCTSLPNIDATKVFEDGMQQIDAQYFESRARIHAEVYETYKHKMKTIDIERSSAVCALHQKVSALHKDPAATPQTSKSMRRTESTPPLRTVRKSPVNTSSNGTNKDVSSTVVALAPICSTPSEESCLHNKTSNPHNLESSSLQFPVELSEIHVHAKNIANTNSGNLAEYSTIPLQKPSDEPTLGLPGSPDAAQRSHDLQNNCRQLSKIRHFSIGTPSIINAGQSARNRRLFPEDQLVRPDPGDIQGLQSDDPMGFDIMKEVSEIAKQVSKQALEDTDAIMSSPLKACHGSPSVLGPSFAASEIAKPSELAVSEVDCHPRIFVNHVIEALGRKEHMESHGDAILDLDGTKSSTPVEVDEYPDSTHFQHDSIGGKQSVLQTSCTTEIPEVNRFSGLSDAQLVQPSHNDTVNGTQEDSMFGTVDATCITCEFSPLLSKGKFVPEQETNQVEGNVQCINHSSPHTEYSENGSLEATQSNCVVIPPHPSVVVQNIQTGPFELQQVQDGVEGRAEPCNFGSIITEVGPNETPLPIVSTNAAAEIARVPLTEAVVPESLHRNETDSIEDFSVNADTRTVQIEHTVGSPLSDGEFFEGAGSVNTAIRARAKRFGKSEDMIDGIAELTKTSFKVNPCASQTYADQVEKSIFWAIERKDVTDPARNCGGITKILIRGVHVSEEEFVHTLMPTGHVDTNFMWLCSEAIMLDWHSKSRTILNQCIIKELTKPHDRCDHEIVASKLKLLPLQQIDQLYLPVPNKKHWILVLITISRRMIEIYDSFRPYKRGDDPYEDLWKTIGYNLQIAFSQAMSKPVPIHDNFEKHYAQIQAQSNLHDCGLEVIRMLVCHNGKDLIGYGKKNMGAYRKEVSHTLLYHRYNDLNPRRHSKSAN